jgi:endonuclease III
MSAATRSRSRGPRPPAKAGARRKAGAPRAAKATSPARAPRRTASPKTRMAKAFPRLEKVYGEIHLPVDTASVLEKAVFLVLREGGTNAGTARALKALRQDFADWNEVRASRPTELMRMLGGVRRASSMRRLEGRVRRIRDMLDQIYGERNDTSLEFLLDLKVKDRYEFLSELDDLGVHNAAGLVQWLSGEDKLVVVTPSMAKAAQKLGLCQSAAVARVRKEVSTLAGRERLVALATHLAQFGEHEPPLPPALQELVD